MDAREARYRARSLWLDRLPGPLTPRPSLGGDLDCDVCIVGAGFTGLWTAYALASANAGLRIAVVEREIAGFGASGRNGGFVSAGIAADARAYEASLGAQTVGRAERAVIRAIDDIGTVVDREGIECGYRRGGSFRVATSRPQLRRLVATVRARRRLGWDEADLHLLTADEIRAHVRLAGIVAGAFTPHCARVDPARLVRGLADACERRGVAIYEGTEATSVQPRRVRCAAGTVRADVVVLATEAYTVGLPGERRTYLPLQSQMVATEPLPPSLWREIGWSRGETVADQRYGFFYAQRTSDDRIAIGGRGAPYRFGARIADAAERAPAVWERLEAAIRRHLPQAAAARITHRWGGVFALPRGWSMAVRHDRGSGLAVAGGYSGHGVVASHLAGRTLADLILDRESDLTALPWVGHRSPPWPPEPVPFLGASVISTLLAAADAFESRLDRRAPWVPLVRPFAPPR